MNFNTYTTKGMPPVGYSRQVRALNGETRDQTAMWTRVNRASARLSMRTRKHVIRYACIIKFISNNSMKIDIMT